VQLQELLGEAFFYSKNYESCLKTLSRVREVYQSSKAEPNDLSRVYNNLGCAYTGLGEKTKAEAFYRKAIKASTDVVGEAHTNLVDLYMEQGRFDEAFPILKTIESHSPKVLENPAWRLRSGLLGARYYLYQKDYETSSRYLSEAQRADHTSAVPCVGISYLLSELKGDYDGAIKTIKTGLVYAPTNLMLLNNLAYNYLMKGDVEKGRLVLDNINEQDALENPHLLATRGLLLIKEGGLEEGARLYNQSINMALDKETRAQIRQKKNLELGRYWLGQGKQEKAKKFLRNVLDIEGHLDIYKQQAATLLQSC
jgi:tetratricopeptide (TPR) repeat protein